MAIIDVKVPSPGESISEVQLASWLAEDGAYVDKDQEIAEIDSDKATLTVAAEVSGKIQLLVEKGSTIEVGSVIARINTEAVGSRQSPVGSRQSPVGSPQPAPVILRETKELLQPEDPKIHLSPLAKKLLEMNKLSESDFKSFMESYRFGKKDVELYLSEKDKARPVASESAAAAWGGSRETVRKKMTTLRLKLADRLVSVKNETAMLTTFNEVNMTPVMKIRNQYKDAFKEKHGTSLGFMSFFTKAAAEALQLFPQVNAQIEGDELVYFNYADIGIAVSTPKGLMVPILRNAERMSLAGIELKIKELATKARDNRITLDDMKGGTFTVTNGGVFGSMLSTPILNPPQSAILGMHNIVERPIAVNGQVEIHPIMYVALSYDHRTVDGRESVSFLVKVKEMLENPAKMLYSGRDPVEKLLGI
jgi:2-oxoglutarate dehydrogenase E2 component (dihydrolipoamide succinyltransferase)